MANIFYYDQGRHRKPSIFYLFSKTYQSLYWHTWYSVYSLGIRTHVSICRRISFYIHLKFDNDHDSGLLWFGLHISFGELFYIGASIPVWYRKKILVVHPMLDGKSYGVARHNPKPHPNLQYQSKEDS